MSKVNEFYGIDISKDIFDLMSEKGVHYQFANDHKGFKKFLKILNKKSHCVMEATGLSLSVGLFFTRKRDFSFCRKPFISQTIYSNEIIKDKNR